MRCDIRFIVYSDLYTIEKSKIMILKKQDSPANGNNPAQLVFLSENLSIHQSPHFILLRHHTQCTFAGRDNGSCCIGKSQHFRQFLFIKTV